MCAARSSRLSRASRLSRLSRVSPMPRASRRARGFTLIEVLIALAIVAIALAASIRAVASMAQATSDLHARLLAGWSADNTLAELHLSHIWPDVGQTKFDCPQGNLALICTETVKPTPNPIFRRVEVGVTLQGRAGELAHMVTVVSDETRRSL